jgi:hypothetical protein
MKNPYFTGRPPGIYDFQGLSQNDKLAMTGMNTGNILFISALHKIVGHHTPTNYGKFVPSAIRQKHDGVVIPAANWFNKSNDLSGLARRIEILDLPTIIVGLGAQSYSQETYPTPSEGTLRLFKVVSERCHSISVRGEYTADALAHHGIKNVTVTGCPSLLWNGSPLRISKPEKKIDKVASSSTRVDLYPHVFGEEPGFGVSRLLTRHAFGKDIDYVAQTELAEMQVSAGETEISQLDSKRRDYVRKLYGGDEAELSRYLKSRIKTFFNVESWTDYLRGMDFTFGTRLHGVIASLLSGTPAALVIHDTRTREMARHLRIPSFEAADIFSSAEAGEFDLQRIYDSLDYAEFNARQIEYFQNFLDYFEKNDVALTISR